MKRFLLIGLPVMFVATPALATGGFDCRTTDGSNLRLAGVVGHVVGAPLVGATLFLGERALATTDPPEPQLVIARSWLDGERIWIDLADPQRFRYKAQLRVRVGAGWTGTGTLVRDGVTHPVRCEVE